MSDEIGFMNVVMIGDSYYEELRKIAVREQKTVVQVMQEAMQKHIRERSESVGEQAPPVQRPQVLCG